MWKRFYKRVTPPAIRSRLSRVAAAFRDQPVDPTHAKWLSDGGEMLALEFDLSPESFVIDVGAFRGRWVADIFSRYQCSIAAIEPVKAFAAEIARKYEPNHKVVVHPVGFGNRTRVESISILADASSTLRAADNAEEVLFVDVDEWLERNVHGVVDLMSMNCEGGEYEILPRLLETEAILRIDRIMIQFHRLGPDAEKRREEIRSSMLATHREVYNYPFLWELWERKRSLGVSGNSTSGDH